MFIHTARSVVISTTEYLNNHIDKYTGNVTWEVISSSKDRNAWVHTSASLVTSSWHEQEQLYTGLVIY
jgi:protoheme ferro-lyase